MEQKFTVLMSLYFKEKPEYARECFNSLLNQTVRATEWVIVEDGSLTEELYNLLDEYQNKYPNLIKRVPLKENRGLGLALREGILHCSNELIARMDTDDICREDRFELQLKEFEKNPFLDICGSHIKEFDGNIANKKSLRKVPLNDQDIKRYQKRRSAFNHMTVMYKKSAVIRAGNYEDCLYMEDDMLWVKMLLANCLCKNIDDYLVYARTGLSMIERRGGIQYYKKYALARKKIFNLGYISLSDYIITLLVNFMVCIMPKYIRMIFFKVVLRGKK